MELITQAQLRPILKEIGSMAVQLQKDHINTQTNIDGSKFAPLKPSTIASKQRSSRGGVQGNAEKRMKATNDFVQNAFKYEVNSDGVTIFISHLPHKQNKTYNARRAYDTRAKHGKTNHKDKASYVNNQGQVITQEDIGGWQLSGEHNTGKRSPHNAGANFFGLSNTDEQKLETIFAKVVPIIDRNIEYAIRNGIK